MVSLLLFPGVTRQTDPDPETKPELVKLIFFSLTHQTFSLGSGVENLLIINGLKSTNILNTVFRTGSGLSSGSGLEYPLYLNSIVVTRLIKNVFRTDEGVRTVVVVSLPLLVLWRGLRGERPFIFKR